MTTRHRPGEFIRSYHSLNRVAFVRDLPCASCGSRSGGHNAHTYSGGMGRKAGYLSIIPLCARCHYTQHQKGWGAVVPNPSRVALTSSVIKAWCADRAADTEAAWRANLQESRNET